MTQPASLLERMAAAAVRLVIGLEPHDPRATWHNVERGVRLCSDNEQGGLQYARTAHVEAMNGDRKEAVTILGYVNKESGIPTCFLAPNDSVSESTQAREMPVQFTVSTTTPRILDISGWPTDARASETLRQIRDTHNAGYKG